MQGPCKPKPLIQFQPLVVGLVEPEPSMTPPLATGHARHRSYGSAAYCQLRQKLAIHNRTNESMATTHRHRASSRSPFQILTTHIEKHCNMDLPLAVVHVI